MSSFKRAVQSQKSIAGNSLWFGLFTYPSKGKRYYRLQWGTGASVDGTLHLRGGAVGNDVVERRAAKLVSWIKAGRTLVECKQYVNSLEKRTSKGDTRGKPRRTKG